MRRKLDRFRNNRYNIVEIRKVRRHIARPKAFDRKKSLVDAMRLFWRKGYAATSIEDLTSDLQLSRSSLYDTFGDKRSLFLEALRLYSAGVTTHIAEVLESAPSPLGGIQTMFNELAAAAGSDAGAMGCLMVNSIAELVPYDAEVTTIAEDYSQNIERLLFETLIEAVAQGEVSLEQTPQQAANFLFNTVQGSRILIKSGASRPEIQAIYAMALQSLT